VRADAWPPGIRGITIGPIESSQQLGRGYGSEYSARLLDELIDLGANAISITPFGRIWSLHSSEIDPDFELPFRDSRAGVLRLAAQAHARGMRVLIVPHLWVETPGWRGEIDPGDETRWAAYQKSYRAFVLSWAEVAREAHADVFSIGVECKSWSGRFGGYWTQLIAAVRAEFPGRLTYSANWDEAPDVLFWDQLDLIGINAFYPLAEHAHASYDDYARGAERALANAAELVRSIDKPLLFVEAGYTSRPDAAVQPWLWPDDMAGVTVDDFEQARALSALLGAALPKPYFAGFFLWRYYANLDDVSQEAPWGFSPHGKLAEPLLRNIFEASWAADPDPSASFLQPSAAGIDHNRKIMPMRLEKYLSSAPPATRMLAPRTPGSVTSGLSVMK
jgi:hypothetical protein